MNCRHREPAARRHLAHRQRGANQSRLGDLSDRGLDPNAGCPRPRARLRLYRDSPTAATKEPWIVDAIDARNDTLASTGKTGRFVLPPQENRTSSNSWFRYGMHPVYGSRRHLPNKARSADPAFCPTGSWCLCRTAEQVALKRRRGLADPASNACGRNDHTGPARIRDPTERQRRRPANP